jgi:hypothetical protein
MKRIVTRLFRPLILLDIRYRKLISEIRQAELLLAYQEIPKAITQEAFVQIRLNEKIRELERA